MSEELIIAVNNAWIQFFEHKDEYNHFGLTNLACFMGERMGKVLQVLDNRNAEIQRLTAELAAANERERWIHELGIELAVMNTTLQKQVGDLPEKSVKNFTAEVKRLADAILLPQPPPPQAQEGQG
jgi:hypothetical protein